MRMIRPAGLVRIAAVAFAVVFVLIVVIADRGEGGRWWAFLEHLPAGDKIGHVGLVGLLAFLGNLAFRPRPAPKPLHLLTLVTMVLLVVLTLEEISQAFLKNRNCDLFDWLADLAGLAVGQVAALLARRCRGRRRGT